jgi:CHAD domain-containing protein
VSYRLTQHETIADGIKRIVIEQIDKALEGLQSKSGSQDGAIHDARVCFKKIRAALRLVETETDVDIFRQENLCYRDAGRRLSAIRDTAAILEAFDKLTARFAEQLSANAFAELRQSLRQSSTTPRLDKQKAMLTVAKTIGAARRRVEHWPIHRDDFAALEQGVKRVYKQGRQSFTNALAQPSVEIFHEWRKDVKYLRYQIRLLKPIWSMMLEKLGDELETLGEYLSEDHDLALLRQHVLDAVEPTDNGTDVDALIALIDLRRGELQVEAKRLGERVYAEKPRTFTGRLQVYWQAWRSDEHMDSITAN